MLVAIGSKNPLESAAVTRVLPGYPKLFERRRSSPNQLDIHTFEVDSGVGRQPRSRSRTVFGAKNRARHAMTALDMKLEARATDLAFGIETGIMRVLGVDDDLACSVCAIYDGTDFHVGFSPAFPLPREVAGIIRSCDVNLFEAAGMAGFAVADAANRDQGLIDLLTGGRVAHLDYTMVAMHMALIGLR